MMASQVTVKLPHVVRERCIGCGICEYKCPVNGEAAIRIFVPETVVPFLSRAKMKYLSFRNANSKRDSPMNAETALFDLLS